jgi:hypothetical protein
MKKLAKIVLLILMIIVLSAIGKWVQDGERIAQASELGWYQLPRHASQVALDPIVNRHQAVIQVLAAPTYGWRGYVAVHPWIIYKRAGQSAYTRYEVIGWGRRDVVKRDHSAPDALWYGARPQVLATRTGVAAQDMIDDIEAAIASYPYPQDYRSYPGPNSNTFIAHIGREVPALGLDLPPTAIGKDYRAWDSPIGHPPSGRGFQVSLGGWFGMILSPEEGVEINLFGAKMGFDVNCPALRLPFLGRVGIDGVWSDRYCLPLPKTSN